MTAFLFSEYKKIKHLQMQMLCLVEYRGLEPLTSTLPVWRAPSCANTPFHYVTRLTCADIVTRTNNESQEVFYLEDVS